MDGQIQPGPLRKSSCCLVHGLVAAAACFLPGNNCHDLTSFYHPSSGVLGPAPPWLYLGAPNSSPPDPFHYFPSTCTYQMLSPSSPSTSLISFLPCPSVEGCPPLLSQHAAGHLALAIFLLGVFFSLTKNKKGRCSKWLGLGLEWAATLKTKLLFA